MRRPLAWLAAIWSLALVIRAAALFATEPTLPAGDEYEYFVRAARMASGAPLEDDGARAPGILFFYAAVFRAFRPWALLAKLANVLVSSLTVLPAFAIGRSFGGARVGLVAAGLLALYPTHVAFSHYLWSESLYIFLLACGVALLLSAVERLLLWRFAAAGVVLGLSALSKEAGLLFPLLAAGWLFWLGRREPLRSAIRSGCLLAALALTLLPWLIHINGPDLPFALITRTAYMNLYIGNHEQSTGHGMQDYRTLAPTRLEAEQVARERALRNIVSRLPWWPLQKIASEVPHFFTPNSFAVRRLLMPAGDPGNWGYRFRFELLDRQGFRVVAAAVVVASYVAIAASGLGGLLLSRRRELSGLFLLFIAGQLLASVVTFSMSRFRLPSMLFLIVGSASFAILGRRDWADAGRGQRLLVAGCLCLLLVLIAMDYQSVLESTGR